MINSLMDLMVFAGVPILGSVLLFLAVFQSMNQIGVEQGSQDNGRSRGSGPAKGSPQARTVVVFLYMVVALAMSLLGNGIINLIVMMIIPLIGHRYYNSERQYLVYYCSFVIVIYLTDAVVLLGLTYLSSSGMLNYSNPYMVTIASIVVLRFAEYAVLKLLTAVIKRKTMGTISGKQLLSFFILPIFSIVNLLTLMFYLDIYVSEDRVILLMVNLILLLGINLYFSSAFEAITRNNRLENELNLHLQQQAIQTAYYEALEQKYDLSRGLIHDIRSHMQGMQQFYEIEKQRDLVAYTDDIHTMLNRLGQRYYTAHKMLNIILNDKVESMLAQGIQPDIKIADVDLGFMRNVDITTLFSNILDNAIAAAKAGPETQSAHATIKLRAFHVHNFVSITLQNTAATEPVRKDALFLSTKHNHEGLGLKNVTRVVEMYKGDVQFEWRDQHFITRIMLSA